MPQSPAPDEPTVDPAPSSSFPCTNCGLCCVVFGRLGLMPSRPDGACIHLTPDNLCAIYDTRPDQCRVPPTRADHALQAAYCNAFQALTGTPDSYRVVLDDPAPDD